MISILKRYPQIVKETQLTLQAFPQLADAQSNFP
jgi:hypothetical protein